VTGSETDDPSKPERPHAVPDFIKARKIDGVTVTLVIGGVPITVSLAGANVRTRDVLRVVQVLLDG
jgi:hypothetical protein